MSTIIGKHPNLFTDDSYSSVSWNHIHHHIALFKSPYTIRFPLNHHFHGDFLSKSSSFSGVPPIWETGHGIFSNSSRSVRLAAWKPVSNCWMWGSRVYCGMVWLVGGLEHFLFSHNYPYIGNNHPNWLSYFSEGFKPPTSWWFSHHVPKITP